MRQALRTGMATSGMEGYIQRASKLATTVAGSVIATAFSNHRSMGGYPVCPPRCRFPSSSFSFVAPVYFQRPVGKKRMQSRGKTQYSQHSKSHQAHDGS